MAAHEQARRNRSRRIGLVASACLLILACAPVAAPLQPTLDPNGINTVIAQTAAAAQTRTAALTPPTWTPSFTPFPTSTASITPTETPTFVFLLPTFTKTKVPTATPGSSGSGGGGSSGGGGTTGGGNKYACSVNSTSPANNTVFSPNEDFDGEWTIKNTGSERWDAAGVDVVHVSGNDMGVGGGFDLPGSVKAGNSIDIGIDMTAPDSPGTYSTTWNLKTGKIYFCNMKITIVVQ